MSPAATSPESLTIRDLDTRVEERLRFRAATNGRSMEAEARVILSDALTIADDEPNLAEAIRRHVAPLGGVELEDYADAIVEPPAIGR